MYAQKMAVAIKVHGRSLRELDDAVFLPFGSEYSIYLKNLNTVRSSINIEIDGQDATEGVSIVINPGQTFELERFIRNGNLSQGNRFKFIQKTAAISAYRGDRDNDGLIKITHRFEKVQYVNINNIRNYSSSAILKGHSDMLVGGVSGYDVRSSSLQSNISGFTAPGSVSNQEFQTCAPLNLENISHSITIKLVGEQDGKQVTQASTTRAFTTCESCGYKTRESIAKFCSQCGTSLNIIA